LESDEEEGTFIQGRALQLLPKGITETAADSALFSRRKSLKEKDCKLRGEKKKNLVEEGAPLPTQRATLDDHFPL